MKIIQLVDRKVDNNQILIGLGDDGNVYTYSYSKGSWKLYAKSEKATK